MSFQIFRGFVLSTVLAGAVSSVATDDLDAALNARKKTAKRRTYSERIKIENLDLVVPKTSTDEERALDRELEQLEKQLNSQPVMERGPAMQRPVAPIPEKPGNWLTPSLLDSAQPGDLSKEKDSEWITEELARQEALRQHAENLEKEEALINKMLREESQKDLSVENSRLKQYEDVLRNTVNPLVLQPSSKSILAGPLDSLLHKEEQASSGKGSLFSPSARANSGVIKPSLSPSPSSPQSSSPQQLSGWKPRYGSTAAKQPKSISGRDWSTQQTKPLSPVERVRRSSPIYRKDPFADDFIPGLKSSIWD